MKIPPVKVYFSEEDRREILRRIDECLSTGMLAQGKNVMEFEESYARYVGAKNAVGLLQFIHTLNIKQISQALLID